MSFVDGLLAGAATQILGDAAAPYALFSSTSRNVGGIIFDVTTREVLSDDSTITVHPVETGTPISDHVFDNPKIIEISAASSDSTAGYEGRAQEVYEQMLALKATKQPFDVSTGKRFYSNMLFGNITVVTDETNEFALFVSARLQEVIITSTSGSGSSSGLDPSAQASPADTTPETDVGQQLPQAVPGPTSFDQSQKTFGADAVPSASIG